MKTAMDRRWMILGLGLALSLLLPALWHGPLGAGDRLAARIEGEARQLLDRYELPMVNARLERGPLRRVLVLSGPADDFQRGELVRLMDGLPGVAEVRWDPASLPGETVAPPAPSREK